jgi:hypothetical protein
MNLKEQKNSDVLIGMFVKNMEHENLLHESLYSIAMQHLPVNLMIIHSGLSEDDLKKLESIANDPTVRVKTNKKTKKKNEDGSETEQEEIVTESAGKSLNYFLVKEEVSSFSDVFNLTFQTAVESGYKYMSITEPEDVYSLNWFNLVDEWGNENPDMAMFLPLIKHMNFGAFQGFMNESCWAEGMAEEVGKYDNNLLLKFNFAAHPLGAVMVVPKMVEQKDAYEIRDGKYYPMKSGIKLFNYYEFFLRSSFHDLKIMNIPRIAYELRVVDIHEYDARSSKIPSTLLNLPKEKGGISSAEAQFWAKYATDAYYMEEDDNTVKYESVA